jgi:hypothetical protein
MQFQRHCPPDQLAGWVGSQGRTSEAWEHFRSGLQGQKPVKICLLLFLTLLSAGSLCPALAQSPRLRDVNTIGWAPVNLSVALTPKWTLNAEYQFRGLLDASHPQQHLLRGILNYTVKPQVQIGGGYCYVYTYSYGDHPSTSFGFGEHRLTEQVLWKSTLGGTKTVTTQRLRLEQRWLYLIPDRATEPGKKEARNDTARYVNRLRFMERLDIPLWHSDGEVKKTIYGVLFDEIFIGFGKNVGQNIFDQNRAVAALGFRTSPHFAIEAGLLSQILEQGGLVSGRQVLQYNTGPWISTIFSLSRK